MERRDRLVQLTANGIGKLVDCHVGPREEVEEELKGDSFDVGA